MTTDTYVVNATSGKVTIIKDDQAVLDYIFDWTNWLNDVTDSISSKVASIGSNGSADGILTIQSSAIDGTSKKVTIWLAGGTVDQTYQVECKITTAAGRTDERSIYVKIKDR